MPTGARGEIPPPATGPALEWQRRVVLIVDLVESVRLMHHDERDTIGRWCAFVDEVVAHVLPGRGGRLVKSLGDGMLLEFEAPADAVAAAFELHHRLARLNQGRPPSEHMCLRIGGHVADIVVTPRDVFGEGVNLCQRLASLAQPGDTMGSAALCEQLLEGIDTEVQDLGECYVKHVDEPVRAYRLQPPDPAARTLPLVPPAPDLRPGIAVVPFLGLGVSATTQAVGDLIADGLILHLSMAKHLRVVSRLSSALFRERSGSAAEMGARLGVRYLLSGRFHDAGGPLQVRWELAETAGQSVVEAGQGAVTSAELLAPDSPFLAGLASMVHDAIFRTEAGRARWRPLPNLDSYALLLGGIQLLHRAAQADFTRSFELLSRLSERHPRAAEPRLWLAKWYALRAVQGQTVDRQTDARLALDCIARAREADPDSAFALAMEGFVHCHLTQDYARASHSLQAAVLRNPSETFGHLFQAVIHGLQADFGPGIAAAERALATSPLDPARYLFHSIAAYLHLGAGQLEQAITLARRSLRQNCLHAHTWRALTIAQVELGDLPAARESVHHLMDVQPGLTLQTYLAGAQPDDPVRQRFAQALGRAGVPAH